MTALAARGYTPIAAPVLEMRTLDAAVPDGIDALAFTSANGVAAFAVRSVRRDLPVFAVGEASAAAARQAGFSYVAAGEAGAAALAPLIAAKLPKGARLLHAAGRDVAGDLGALLPGIAVTRVTLYEMDEAAALPAEALTALQGRAGVLLYSARSAAAFGALAGEAGQAVAICLSAQVAAAAGPLGFAEVLIADHPSDAAMLDCLETVKGRL